MAPKGALPLTFFDYDNTKLKRLRTGKASYKDKISRNRLIGAFFGLIAIAVIIYLEITKFGKQKSESFSLEPAPKYEYNIND